MKTISLCVALDGTLELWTPIIEKKCGFLVHPDSGEPQFGAIFARYRWEIEMGFANEGAVYRIPTEIFKHPPDNTIVVQTPEFWGREVIDEWEE